MKRLMFALPLLAILFMGCSADSVVGPQDDEGVLVPAELCNPNIKPC